MCGNANQNRDHINDKSNNMRQEVQGGKHTAFLVRNRPLLSSTSAYQVTGKIIICRTQKNNIKQTAPPICCGWETPFTFS